MHSRITAIAILAGAAMSVHAADANLPLTHLTLYRSGVGSFTHTAAVEGTTVFDLTFNTNNVDDVLKSLLLLDSAKNATASVSYQSNEDLNRRLSKFSINVNQAAHIDDLFTQLRGTEITLETPDATVTGSILGVEARPMRATTNTEPYTAKLVNLITATGIRSVPIESITNFTFTDNDITEELNAALKTLMDNRTDNLRDMEVTFATDSNKRRPVAVSYVHEMPVWKTAYRVVIPRGKDAGKTLTLQAWAIIENTTNTDWTDVKLSLAAGKPVSFTMNLDEAIYARRPEYPVPIGGLASAVAAKAQTLFKRSVPVSDYAAGAREQSLEILNDQLAFASSPAASVVELDAESLGAAVSSASQEGGLFLFTLDAPLNLESQQSAMLPIANTQITGDPVSIYNAEALDKHPLLSVRFTNDTGLHLMPGPITVYDGDRYAGDAQIGHTSRGEEDRFTYALDLDVHANRTRADNTYDIRWSINDGLITRRTGHEITWTYTFKNLDTNERTLLVDHRKTFGPQGMIIRPEDPKENTEALITREITIDPAGETELVITERNEDKVTYQMGQFDPETFIGSATKGSMSEAVVKAMRTIAQKRRAITELEEQINRNEQLVNEIIRDQARIRNNMQSLDRNAELYRTYYAKLTEQESQITDIRINLETTRDQLTTTRADLRNYLANLNIE